MIDWLNTKCWALNPCTHLQRRAPLLSNPGWWSFQRWGWCRNSQGGWHLQKNLHKGKVGRRIRKIRQLPYQKYARSIRATTKTPRKWIAIINLVIYASSYWIIRIKDVPVEFAFLLIFRLVVCWTLAYSLGISLKSTRQSLWMEYLYLV